MASSADGTGSCRSDEGDTSAVTVLHPASYGTENKCFFFPALCCGKENFFMKNRKIGLFGSVKNLTMAAMLTALGAVIGYLCKIIPILNIGSGLRITFENLPIIMAGMMFGPIAGGCVGGVADILSCLFAGDAPMPWITVGSVAVGVVSGIVSKYIIRKNGIFKIVMCELLAHLIGSMIVKTVTLYFVFGPIVYIRIPISIGIMIVETVVICAMYKNKAVRAMIDSQSGGRKQ